MPFDDFMMAAAAGFLATYVHMVAALWAPKFGLPRLDFAKALAELTFAGSFEGNPPYWLGLLVLHLNGIVFALLYATVFGPVLPGIPLARGLLFGGILLIGSRCLFVPVFLGEGFFGRKGNPRAWMTAVVVHAIFGAIIGWLCPIV